MTHEMRFGLIPGHKFTVHIHDPVFEHKNLLRTLEISKKQRIATFSKLHYMAKKKGSQPFDSPPIGHALD